MMSLAIRCSVAALAGFVAGYWYCRQQVNVPSGRRDSSSSFKAEDLDWCSGTVGPLPAPEGNRHRGVMEKLWNKEAMKN